MEFSIIVPVFNAEKYLSQSIGSVLAQGFPDWELILVDDGSSDDSGEICEKAAAEHENIRVLRRANGGQLTARLDGVKAAEGEYCLFLDADDLLEPHCLQTLHKAIEEYHAPDMVIYSFTYIEPDGKERPAAPLFQTQRLMEGDEKKELYTMFLTHTGLNNVWTKAVKRTVFSGEYPDYTPFSRLRTSEDRLLSMGLITNAQSIVCLPQALIRYRLFPGSVTREYSPVAVERFNVSCLYPVELHYFEQWGMLSPDTRARLNASCVAQTLYVLDLNYRNLKDPAGRQRLLQYPWRSFLPEESLSDYETNPYINETQKKLLTMLLNGDRKGLQAHFRKKDHIKKLRTIKQKLTGK